MSDLPGTERRPNTSWLQAMRKRLELPAIGGPRWLRSMMWLRWLVVPAIVAGVLSAGEWKWAGEFPVDVGRDVGREIDNVIDWMTTELDVFFDVIKEVVLTVLIAFEDFLLWLPWPAFIATITIIAWRTAGYWVAAFSAASLTLLATFGLWESTMETVALMAVTVTLSVAIAVPLGVWASQSDRLDRILRPILDGMQTMPSFVYLVPAIAFFSLGNVPAVIATLIYAVPPAVRLTNLGIRQLPEETLEAAESFGATPIQLLLKVKIPAGHADHHGGREPDDPDGPGDGRDRLARGGRGAGRGREPRTGTDRARECVPGGLGNRLPRDHHRPNYAGICQPPAIRTGGWRGGRIAG